MLFPHSGKDRDIAFARVPDEGEHRTGQCVGWMDFTGIPQAEGRGGTKVIGIRAERGQGREGSLFFDGSQLSEVTRTTRKESACRSE